MFLIYFRLKHNYHSCIFGSVIFLFHRHCGARRTFRRCGRVLGALCGPVGATQNTTEFLTPSVAFGRTDLFDALCSVKLYYSFHEQHPLDFCVGGGESSLRRPDKSVRFVDYFRLILSLTRLLFFLSLQLRGTECICQRC
jgi:hypothetical protein